MQTGVVSKQLDGSSKFFGMHASFHLSYTVNSSSYKIRVFSSVTLSQTLDIKQISPRQVDRVANKTRRWSSLLTTLNNGRRAVAGRSTLCTHHEQNLRPCCSNSITSICFFLPLCNSWQDFNWHNASPVPSAVVELYIISVRLRKLTINHAINR